MSTKKGYKLVPWLFGKEIEIPEEWEITTLKENSHITDGSHFSPPKVTKGFPMATVENLKDSSLDIDSCYNISKEDFKQLTKNNCKPEINDVLFTKDGTVGKSLVFTQNIDVVLLSSIAILKPFESLDPYFLHYSFHSEAITKFIAKFLGGTAIKRIVLKNLEKFLFPLPSLSEQQKIVTILSNVDSLIDSTSKIIENSKSLKTGLMQKLLTKGIGHTKFKKVPWLFGKEIEIPVEWELDIVNVLTLQNDKGAIRMGPFGSNLKTSELLDSGKIKTLWIENIVNNEFTWKYQKFITEKKYEELKSFTVKPNDILITMMGTLGRVAIVPDNIGTAIISSHLLKISLDQKKANYLFLYYILKSHFVFRQIIKESRGLVMGGLNTGIIKNLHILIPPLPEQQKIATILSNIDAQINSQTQYKEKLERLKKSLMQKLLTGEVRVAI